jgi:hypothetical protein
VGDDEERGAPAGEDALIDGTLDDLREGRGVSD